MLKGHAPEKFRKINEFLPFFGTCLVTCSLKEDFCIYIFFKEGQSLSGLKDMFWPVAN